MKILLLLFVVALVGYSMAATTGHSRGCIYIMGRCSEECEEGTHAYALGCGFKTPEATCDEPNPVEETGGMLCDFSACYCDSPTVRDTTSGNCVPIDECPKKEESQ